MELQHSCPMKMDEDEAQKQVITYKLNEEPMRNILLFVMFVHIVKCSCFISHVGRIYVLLEA